MKKTKKKQKNKDVQKKRSSHKVREVSPEAGRWKRFVKEIGFEPGVKE